jgi:ABC-type nitrate/sulfonate/bicarbonate transport system ATPase subunit
MASDPNWMFGNRRANQTNNFKQQTVYQYRQLELNVLRKVEVASMEDAKPSAYFTNFLKQINALLDNVRIERDSKSQSFKLLSRADSSEIYPNHISSGESELIALAIESLSFVESISPSGRGLLLFDEPDVHLHPDLQSRFMRFVMTLLEEYPIDVLIATHSTAVLGELATDDDSTVCFLSPQQSSLVFERVDQVYKELLPVFGAHPLTQVFNSTRTLLVEGDDDVRIWQEVVRKKLGTLRMTPIGCGGTSYITTYEKRMAQILAAVYDNGIAYSLRDADGVPDELNNDGPVVRIRMRCYSAENLLLSDEVLRAFNIDWEEAKSRIDAWCNADINKPHDKYAAMKTFVEGGYDRKNRKIKSIRNLLLAQVLQSELSWEIIVGTAIAKLDDDSGTGPDSLRSYLGDKAVKQLLGIGQ